VVLDQANKDLTTVAYVQSIQEQWDVLQKLGKPLLANVRIILGFFGKYCQNILLLPSHVE
jgi:hypothetical protein